MTADSTSSNFGPGRQPHLNRLLLRGLDRFPDLAATMRDQEIRRMYHAATRWLAAQADPKEPERDWPALAAVLAGPVSIYRLLCHVFGQHPAGIDQDRYVAALAELAAALLDGDGHLPPPTATSNRTKEDEP